MPAPVTPACSTHPHFHGARIRPGLTPLAAGAVGPALFPLAVGLLLVIVAYGRWRLRLVRATS